MAKKSTVFLTTRLDADLYQKVVELTRKEPGKPYLTVQHVVNEAIRQWLQHRYTERRSDGVILAEAKANAAKLRRKPK